MLFAMLTSESGKTGLSAIPVLYAAHHVSVSEVTYNGISHAFVGSNCVQVWDLFCGSLQIILRPAPGSNITALASGTVHATQVACLLSVFIAWDS